MRQFLLFAFLLLNAVVASATDSVRVAIVGVSHDHVFGLLGRPRDLGDIEIVAVVDADEELARQRMRDAELEEKLYYPDLQQALRVAKPQAAVLFGSIRAHHEQAVACAGAGVHVMVEKPLATNLADARAMADAAEKAGIHLLTNYETTWYRNLHEIKRRVDAHEQGDIRRMVFRMGHAGPIEIGCREPFLEWLLDPVENGGGAVTDFGCYGANLATWLMNGERPIAVSCVTKQIKPQRYPNVDDDATITIEYDKAIAVVQASWNWPYNVKDAVVYGATGELRSKGDRELSGWRHGEDRPTMSRAPELPETEADPFAHLAAVVRGEAKPNALSSVENNLLVVEVLDAARESAKTGRRVVLAK